ncbi:MAG: hypothetical protein IAF38_22260 [Bacteroidia bacterium]|nr:hypothetical protein [Bacteroidia bacterium]
MLRCKNPSTERVFSFIEVPEKKNMGNLKKSVERTSASEKKMREIMESRYSKKKHSNEKKPFTTLIDKQVPGLKSKTKEKGVKGVEAAYSNIRNKDNSLNAINLSTDNHCGKDFLKESETCRKLVIEMIHLVGKKMYKEAGVTGIKAMKIAERNELFAEQFIVCEQYILGNGFYGKDFGVVMEKMKVCMEKMHLFTTVKMLFYETRKPGLSGVLPSEAQLEEWELRAGVIDRKRKKIVSERVEYYYHLARLHIELYRSDIRKVLFYISELNKVLLKNKVFDDDFLSGNVKACNALVKILEGEKIAAQKILGSLTEEEIKKCAVDDFFILENIFVSALHCSLPEKLKTILLTISYSSALKENAFLKFKWNYFKATAQFLSSQYAAAEKSLAEIKFSRKPHCCQEVYSIVLNIMCIAEQQKWEMLNMRSEALRKFFYRSAKYFEHTDKRLLIICGIMKHLAASRFDFVKTRKEQANLIKLLKEGEGELAWKPYGHELVRFDKWIETKDFMKKN